VVSLSACASQAPANLDRIAEVEEQGILRIVDHQAIYVEETATPTAGRQTATALVGSMVEYVNLQLWVWFPRSQGLSFERDYGNVTLTIPRTQRRVLEGDKLVHLEYDNERMEIDRADIQRRLDQLNRNFTNEAQRLRAQLENARYALDSANERDWVDLALQHAQAELAYERLRISTENSRTYLQQQLADLDDALAGEYITAPFDGFVQWISFSGNGFSMRGPVENLIHIACEENLFFGVNIRPDQLNLLNYGSIVTVRNTGGAIEFEAAVVSDPWAQGQRDHNFTFWLSPVDFDGLMEALYEIDPYDPLHTLRSMALRAYIHSYVIDEGILLPNNAIHLEDRRRFVWVYDNGNVVRRFIDIGRSIGGYTHVITGIEADTEVVIMR